MALAHKEQPPGGWRITQYALSSASELRGVEAAPTDPRTIE